MYKLAIIGDTDSVLAFQAVGMDAYLTEPANAEEVLKKQFRSGRYAIIFLSESLAGHTAEYLLQIGKEVFPAVTILPLGHENKNLGIERMRSICIRAVGTDLISKK